MGLSGDEARYIMGENKRLARRLEWEVASGNRTGCARRVKVESRVIIGTTMPRGIVMRVSMIPQYADRATFQLECENPGFKSRIPLFRLEWNPMRPHTNGTSGPEELHGLFIDAGVTHAHSCLDHIDAETDRVPPTGVHSARIIAPDFVTYDDALLWFCRQTKIVNPGALPPPPTQFELL